jgi:hypothetical protein
MEESIFPRPAVAGLLQKGFVESRHHVDVQSSLTKEQFDRNRLLRDQLASTKAMPFYVICDPVTGKALRATGLSGGPGAWEELFVQFLIGDSK